MHKVLVSVSQNLLFCVHCITKEKTHLFKYPSLVSEAEWGSMCHEYATTLKKEKNTFKRQILNTTSFVLGLVTTEVITAFSVSDNFLQEMGKQ